MNIIQCEFFKDFYLVEGKHLVDEAYKNEKLIQILSSDESLFIDGIDCIRVTYDILKKFAPNGGVVKQALIMCPRTGDKPQCVTAQQNGEAIS